MYRKKETTIMRIIQFILPAVIFFTTAFLPQTIHASTISASSAAFNAEVKAVKRDDRAQVLKAYLTKRNSPLVESAATFVAQADKNKLDWKLVAAISGLESGFGKHIPQNSYNGWGWGVYGDNVHSFTSWDDGISTISKGLREKYMDKWNATDVASIGRIYAASPTWAQRVTYFMNDIEKFEENWADTTLSLSI